MAMNCNSLTEALRVHAATATFALALASSLCAADTSSDASVLSLGVGGTLSDDDSYFSVMSADGRYVLFQSRSANLVAGDNNGNQDVFLHDRRSGRTELLSLGLNGSAAKGSSAAPSMSADAGIIAWESNAPDLVEGDHNRTWDVFVYNARSGSWTRLGSTAPRGGRSGSPSVSGDGAYVAFSSQAALTARDNNDTADIYRYEVATGKVELVTKGANGASTTPALNGDGSVAAYLSLADNLAGADGNGVADVYVTNLRRNTTTRASTASDGTRADAPSTWPAISPNGRYVAFASSADTLKQGDSANWGIYLHDLSTGRTRSLSRPLPDAGADAYVASGRVDTKTPPSFTGDGRSVLFHSSARDLAGDDGDDRTDVFVYDLVSATLKRVRLLLDGAPAGHCFVPQGASAERLTASCVTGLLEDGRSVRDILVTDTAEVSVSD